MRLDINANDLLTVLRLAELSAEDEEKDCIERIANTVSKVAQEGIGAAFVGVVEPI